MKLALFINDTLGHHKLTVKLLILFYCTLSIILYVVYEREILIFQT